MKKHKRAVKNCQEQKFGIETFRELAYNDIVSMAEASLQIITNIMRLEVEVLCGEIFSHKRGDFCHRGGSEKGSIYMNGQRVPFIGHRVRKGKEEVSLVSYEKLRNPNSINDYVLRLLSRGVSVRKYDELLLKISEESGLSKSSVSRQFVNESREILEKFKNRDFSGKEFFSIIVDGTSIGEEMVVVAMGIDVSGSKHFLGFSTGSSENTETVKDVLSSLEGRGIKFTDRVLCITDGSKALRKALTGRFGDKADFQRCTNHKAWNIYAKLADKYHSEFTRRYRKALGCNSYEDAKEGLDSLEKWLDSVSFSAAESLRECSSEILTLHKIEMPAELRISFHTTNLIESAFSSPKSLMKRIKIWDSKTDMIPRWVAVNLVHMESKFRSVRGKKEINNFLFKYLKKDKTLDKKEVNL